MKLHFISISICNYNVMTDDAKDLDIRAYIYIIYIRFL